MPAAAAVAAATCYPETLLSSLVCAHMLAQRLGLLRPPHVARRGLPSNQEAKTLPAEIFFFEGHWDVLGTQPSLTPLHLNSLPPLPPSAPQGHQCAQLKVATIMLLSVFRCPDFRYCPSDFMGPVRGQGYRDRYKLVSRLL